MEDLWQFNEEVVARAIDDSAIPTICWRWPRNRFYHLRFCRRYARRHAHSRGRAGLPRYSSIKKQLNTFGAGLEGAWILGLQSHAQTLDYLARRLISPMQQIDNKKMQINGLERRMDIALQGMLKTHQQHVLRLNSSLQQLNPQNVLARGYAMVQDASGKLVTAAETLKMGDSVSITFKQGSADATVIRVQSD